MNFLRIPSREYGFFLLEEQVRITLNGLRYDTSAGSVAELLRELNIENGRVAVEVNLEVVRKVDYTSHNLGEGDRVEVVNFVGGG